MSAVTEESLALVAATLRRALVAEIDQVEHAAVLEAKHFMRERCPESAVGVLSEAAPLLIELEARLRRHDAGQRKGWRPPLSQCAVARDSLAHQNGGE